MTCLTLVVFDQGPVSSDHASLPVPDQKVTLQRAVILHDPGAFAFLELASSGFQLKGESHFIVVDFSLDHAVPITFEFALQLVAFLRQDEFEIGIAAEKPFSISKR